MKEFVGLRVALVGPLPPPAGGMANQTHQLAELLRGEGAYVDLVQTNAAYRPTWISQVPGLRAFFRLLPYLLNLWRAAGRNQLLHVMANSGWSWHLFAAPAIWIGFLKGKPVLVNYRGGEAGSFLERQSGVVRFSLRRASSLLVPSGFLEAIFAQHGFTSTVLPNVVDLQRFYPTENSENPATNELRLLVARNLELLYDNATAIRAFARIREAYPNATLTVAGSGPEKGNLMLLAEQLGIGQAVRFTGRLDREAMANEYRLSAISINPSLADNMPNSVLESLASGVPIVTTNVGGVPYLVKDGTTALFVPINDDQAMAEALLRLLKDVPLCKRLREEGLAEVRRYTWAKIGPQLAESYRLALKSSPSKF
ncbi:glycosyltransferase family 4 protein [Paucibacter sp. AS339]|uniref:glycosyltransferase family 4 protein n=1 Tax=Paucibacter hankyongi TaxID=3133434 RepID=UPI0030955AEC